MTITVQCPSCETAFPVDTDKVPEGGVDARCSVCSDVFRVEKAEEEVEGRGSEEAGASETAGPAVAEPPELTPTWEDELAAAEEPAPSDGWEDELAVEAEEPGPAASGVEQLAVEPTEPAEEREPTTARWEGEPLEAQEGEPLKAQEGEPLEAQEDLATASWEGAGGSAAVEAEPVEAGAAGPETVEAEIEEETPAAGMEAVEAEPAEAEPAEPEPAEPEPAEPEPPEAEAPGPHAGAAPEAVPAPAEPPSGFQFGKRDPHEKAQRLARVLVSDMIMYNPERHGRALDGGTLKADFEDEIRKSWDEYVDQVGQDMAVSTSYFSDALNDILARGERIFEGSPPR